MKVFPGKLVRVLIFAVAVAVGAASVSFASDGQETHNISNFKLRAIDGKEVELSTAKGSALTVVTFFATWNPRSATILKELHKLHEKLESKGLAIYAINAESETTPSGFDAQLAAYVKENQVDYPVLLDTGLNTYRAWSIKAMPTTYLLDKDLKVVAYVPGAPSSIHDILFESSMKALGLATEHPDAEAAPTRYQAARNEMLNYGLAEKLLERGSPHKALDKIEAVVEKDAKFPDAFALKGVILLSISEEGESAAKAREAFKKALALDPNLPTAIMGEAYFSAVDGDSKASIEKARKALGMKAWGFAKKPEQAKLAEYATKLTAAEGLLGGGKSAEANTELGAVLEDFVVVRKRVKVDMKRMRELEEKTRTQQQ